VGEGTCPPPEVFGSDQTNGVLQIKLAACKPNQTFVFDTEPNVPWVSVWASDQTQPLVPLIEKIVFPDPIVDGVPTLQHIAYTDAFPYDPSAAVQMPFCKLDPRDQSDASGMTLASAFKPDSTKSQVLPTDIGTTTPASSSRPRAASASPRTRFTGAANKATSSPALPAARSSSASASSGSPAAVAAEAKLTAISSEAAACSSCSASWRIFRSMSNASRGRPRASSARASWVSANRANGASPEARRIRRASVRTASASSSRPRLTRTSPRF